MIAIVLQFWQQDREQAMILARRIADLEPKFREDVKFCFVNRYDCPPVDGETVAYVSRKFAVSRFQTSTKAEGWPAGANGMACDVFAEALERIKSEWSEVTGLLLLEPDCVPLQRDWLDQLIWAWEGARKKGKLLLGTWRPSGGDHGHINGVCMIVPTIARIFDMKYVEGMIAWDCHFSPRWHKDWQRSGLFLNLFQTYNVTARQLEQPTEGLRQPCLVHGVKDASAWNIAQVKLA